MISIPLRCGMFSLSSPHRISSIPNIITQLIEDGFLLSQIRIAYNPSAASVAVLTDYERPEMVFTWTPADPGKDLCLSGLDDAFNAGEIVSRIMSRE